ncbi:MAG TPA: DUF4242 domain-containing protein [Micromonosporaceae bacterium]|nr:DUF4242 domain-containing protein [Micromonosporaceae bacterium]
MTKFMDVHHGFKGITQAQLKEAHAADVANQDKEGVKFESAWADPEAGIIYCLSEAPNAEAVQRVHEKAGHRADEVHPVPLMV